jgi:hypothetical protein
LFEQYVGCGRTLPDLAREKNMSTANMARWAHFHQIPLRPRGGASHDSALRTIDQAADLRLERDIGGLLLERAERGRPMTPTSLGKQVLTALHRTRQLAE